MAKAKSKEVLDWHGNPIPGVTHKEHAEGKFKIYEDEHGKKYWINESGERDYELPYLVVSKRSENGTVETIYDSRCDPPAPAKA